MTDDRILAFYRQLKIMARLPKGVEVMNPYLDDYSFGLCARFYHKYYHDETPRSLLLGINPGRFGSGTTGISFTDPVKLDKICGIENTFAKKTELSADFIYRMIGKFGGPDEFYRRYFISAVSPLGFTREGKNINYYDDKKLETAVTPFIVDSIKKILSLGIRREKCFCIGEGKNAAFLKKLNAEHHWFKEIMPLSHPRFIMQYKRKSVERYVGEYLRVLSGSATRV